MRFFDLLHYDVYAGLVHEKKYLLLIPLTIGLHLYAGLMFGMTEYTGTVMDYMFYLFHGAEPFSDFYGSDFFSFPTEWFLLFGICCYLGLPYPFRDLNSFGQQVMLRSSKRCLWVYAKLAWCILSVVVELLIVLFTSVIYFIITQIPFHLNLTPELLRTLFAMVMDDLMLDLPPMQSILICVVLPFLVLIALQSLQFAIGVLTRPIIGFFSVLSILAVSAIWTSPLAYGNYAMALRSSWVLQGGVEPLYGVLLSIFIILFSGLAAQLYFKRYDIFIKEGFLWN